jgi:hypothetical protein
VTLFLELLAQTASLDLEDLLAVLVSEVVAVLKDAYLAVGASTV